MINSRCPYRLIAQFQCQTLPSIYLVLRVLFIDSIDFLNFIIALSKELGVEVQEADYPKMATLSGCVTHVASLLNTRAGFTTELV